MSEQPICPYCGGSLNESVPSTLESSIKLRCPHCDELYSFEPGIGSYPIEDELGVSISSGLFHKRLTIGETDEPIRKSVNGFPTICSCIWIAILSLIIIYGLFMIIQLFP